MEINKLKLQLFTDLEEPMAFLNSKGMVSNGLPVFIEYFGDTVFFLNQNRSKWSVLVPDCTVVSSSVNNFGPTGVSQITVKLSSKTNLVKQLKIAAELVYNSNLLPCTHRVSTFEEFWTHCGKPESVMSVETPCFSKRGHHQTYINVYDQNLNELSGKSTPQKNGKVTLSLRFSLSESNENGHYGFRPYFDSGILIQTLSNKALVLKRPWSQIDKLNESLKFDLYDSFVMKTPALVVVETEGKTAVLDCNNKKDFVARMQQIHHLSNNWAWDFTVIVCSDSMIQKGDVCIFNMWCEQKEQGDLKWYSHQIRKSRKRKY